MFKILHLRFKRKKKSDLPEIRDWSKVKVGAWSNRRWSKVKVGAWSKRRWSKLKLVHGVRVERCSKFGIIGRRWYQFWASERCMKMFGGKVFGE